MLFQKLFNDETVYLVSEEAERQEFIKRLVCSKNKCSNIRVINVLSFVFLLLNPGERASIPETVILAAVVLSANKAPGACSQPAAPHCASKPRGCWDS